MNVSLNNRFLFNADAEKSRLEWALLALQTFQRVRQKPSSEGFGLSDSAITDAR